MENGKPELECSTTNNSHLQEELQDIPRPGIIPSTDAVNFYTTLSLYLTLEELS
jgi:hypothetical protein